MAAKKNYPPFHVSVNRDGIVSLWDTEEAAHNAHVEDVYVRLELTVEQVQILDRAQYLANAQAIARASLK